MNKNLMFLIFTIYISIKEVEYKIYLFSYFICCFISVVYHNYFVYEIRQSSDLHFYFYFFKLSSFIYKFIFFFKLFSATYGATLYYLADTGKWMNALF